MTPAAWDIAVVAFVAAAALRGGWRGGLRELCSLLGLLAGVASGWWWMSAGSAGTGTAGASQLAGEALTFVGIVAGLWALGGFFGWLLETLVHSRVGRLASAALGLLAGSMKGALVAGLLLFFLYVFVPEVRAVLGASSVAHEVLRATVALGQELIRIASYLG